IIAEILRELVDRDAKTCMWFHGIRTFRLLTTIPPTAEPCGRCGRAGKKVRERDSQSGAEWKPRSQLSMKARSSSVRADASDTPRLPA
ncbi:hypothetical protein, partial [Erythrobacter sp. HI0063]|uniref:hypothetical protein n=1 Tax=Erythrobacter sp. HI0063 TaxID=1822240 RepID=UPI001F195E9A